MKSENDVVVEKVKPYICDNLKWPDQLVSDYGRVPVQMGSSTKWADLVCYISKDRKAAPWILLEVKKPGIQLEEAVPQAESYSLILNSPFFCVTDGDMFDFYVTGHSQRKSIKLQGSPSIPSSDYLKGVDFISFPPEIDEKVELFFKGLKEERKFFKDTKGHNNACKALKKKVFMRIGSLSPKELQKVFDKYLMIGKKPNKKQIFRQIERNFNKVKKILEFIRDFSGDPVTNINKLMDIKGDLHIKGGGIFFISQLLAGAHPNEYVVLQDNVHEALKSLGMTDMMVKNDTANSYVYLNEICIRLFKDKLEPRVKEYGFGLETVHNFLWHYYTYFRKKEGKWYP